MDVHQLCTETSLTITYTETYLTITYAEIYLKIAMYNTMYRDIPDNNYVQQLYTETYLTKTM